MQHLQKTWGEGAPLRILELALRHSSLATVLKFSPFILLQTLLQPQKSQLFCFQTIPNSFAKTPGVGYSPPRVPLWIGLSIRVLAQPRALLRGSNCGVHAARRPPKSPREAGCDTPTPFSFHRFRRGRNATSFQFGAAPWPPHRPSWQFLPAPLQYAGPEFLAPASRAQSGIYLACAIRCVAARTASHTARHRSSRFLSGEPSRVARAVCCRCAARAFSSSRGRNAPAAPARAPLPRTTLLPFQVGGAWRTRGEDEVRK